MNNIKTTDLSWFENKTFILSGVDRETKRITDYNYYYGDEESQVIRFELDNIIYVAVEDNNDGYRSAMDKIFIDTKSNIKTRIPGHKVYAKRRNGDRYSKNDTIEFIDIITNDLVLAIGTDNWDDYYPMFVNEWDITNLAINKAPKLYQKSLRLEKLKRILDEGE